MDIKIEGNEGNALIGTVEWLESVIEQGEVKFRDRIGLVRQMSDYEKTPELAYGHELWMDYIWGKDYGYYFGCREEHVAQLAAAGMALVGQTLDHILDHHDRPVDQDSDRDSQPA